MRPRPNYSGVCSVIECAQMSKDWEDEVDDLYILNVELDNERIKAETEELKARTEFYRQATKDIKRITDSLEAIAKAISGKLK